MNNNFGFTDRTHIAYWLNQRAMLGAAAEIGCAFGGFAREILPKWNGRKYYMVDLWARQPQAVYKEKTDDVNYEGWYRDCKALADANRKVVILRGPSFEMAKHVRNGELDWVFIDANHCFEAVTADMNAWWPKVKVGGVFSGHDYGHDTTWPHCCEVKPAVDRWMAEHGVQFEVCADSWWSIKPGK